MRLNIFKEVDVRVPRKAMAELFDVVARSETGLPGAGQVNIVFSTDRHLRRLNRQFRRRHRTTDVLSFTVDRTGGLDATVGEIYISVPAARRQAKEYGGSLGEELLRLACHGLLHLLGYDHETPKHAALMRAREDMYLSLIRGR
jgi:probable rRNA maturation factor